MQEVNDCGNEAEHRVSLLCYPPYPCFTKLFLRPAALFCFLAPLLLLNGCSKKSLNSSEIHAVSQDLAAAARNVTGPNAQITIRPENVSAPGNAFGAARDNIRISITDAGKVAPLERALNVVAKKYHLSAAAVSSKQGTTEFLRGPDSQITHTIQIIVAAQEAETPAAPPTSNLPPVGGRGPKLAIVIDDLGRDVAVARKLLQLPYPLTVSVIPNLPDSVKIAEAAFRRGDEVLLHLPMQAQAINPTLSEPVELRVGMQRQQVEDILAADLKTVPHVKGVNNHQGSRATADAQLMDSLMASLRDRGLFFIDSRTSAETLAYAAAEKDGVRAAFRNAQFLDDVPTIPAVSIQLQKAANDALRKGWALTIGHPHPATIKVLARTLPRLRSRGIQLVFASDLVK